MAAVLVYIKYKISSEATEKAGVEQMKDERKRYKFAIKTEAKWL